MSDIPIIFSASMVKALLAKRKTMTRRLAWRICRSCNGQRRLCDNCADVGRFPSPWQKVKPGDRLWVRESFCPHPSVAHGQIAHYRATIGNPHGEKWRPSIYMPRWASRLTLTVTAVKIERLQEISEEDARAEGARERHDIPVASWGPYGQPNRWSMEESPLNTDHCLSAPRWAFGNYWNKLHGIGAWDANPEVIVLSFSVEKINIDARKAA
jgi:hypothetical protein